MTAPAPSRVPAWANVHLSHAALQRIADEAGVDLLHIKGPATDAALRRGMHRSADADVLVRPAHLDRLTAALLARGWTLYTGFDEGSPFGHAANYAHPSWSFADVHRRLPGPRADPGVVFDRLWRDRGVASIAHRPCTVLSPAGQVLVQTLHAARSRGSEQSDAWLLCGDELRAETRRLAEELQAATALAAGIGELDEHRGAPDHALWSYWSRSDGDRLDEWAARLRAADGWLARMRVLRQALRVNRTHLALRLGREPSRGEVLREQAARIRLAGLALRRRLNGARS
ncbi:nucleotidyltransferase family protein [Microbacterium sp. 22242]|uniref:nucleotidyltransferase family protein n=1 Tax=Microbacterium sp. 22242 TaxID=3453896 RepID=UPI003F87E64D